MEEGKEERRVTNGGGGGKLMSSSNICTGIKFRKIDQLIKSLTF